MERKTGFRNTHSSEKMDWRTPEDLFSFIESKLGKFQLDVCASAENSKCKEWFNEQDDCLKQDWSKEGRIKLAFCNPPYGKSIPSILRKAKEESELRRMVVAILVFVRCDTKWWHATVPYASEVWLFKGRIKFEHPDHDGRSCATAPSCLIVFDGNKKEKETRFIHVDYKRKKMN